MISTGIQYHALVPRLVSAVEEREAAVFNLYNWRDWRGLTWEERAEGMAFFRVHRAIELHQNEAVAREIKRQSSKRGS